MRLLVGCLDSMPLERVAQADIRVEPRRVVMEVHKGPGSAIEDPGPHFLEFRHRPELGEHRLEAFEGSGVGVAQRQHLIGAPPRPSKNHTERSAKTGGRGRLEQ